MAVETREYFEQLSTTIGLPAVDAMGGIAGLAEASLRSDNVSGTDTSPVGFLEDLCGARVWPRLGIGRALVAGVEDGVRAAGCSELASDAYLTNAASHAAHRAYGFAETERVVYFRKSA